jgi:peptidoglycan/LPS O-acetylase OafA/YrhL
MTTNKIILLPQLTSLRFFAALAIVVLHYRDLLGPLPNWLRTIIIGGQYGVSFFFILSGFILYYNYESWFKADVDSGKFWKFQRYRFAKIYPIYLLGLLIDTPWQLIVRLQNGEIAAKGHEYWASWLINALGLQSWTPGVPYTLVWNTPSWSVSAEMFFYLTFPFICYFLARKVRSMNFLLGLSAALLVGSSLIYIVVIHLIYVVFDMGGDVRYSIQFYTPLLRLPEFIIGCIAGQIFTRMQDPRMNTKGALFETESRRNIIVIVCVLLCIGRICMPAYDGPSRGLWLADNAIKFSFFMIPFAAIILAVANGKTFLSKFLSWPLLVLLGEASYALYITHWVGQSLMQLGYMGAYKTPLMSVAFIILSVVLSVFLYKYFETPMRLKLRGKSGAPSPIIEANKPGVQFQTFR